MQTTARWVGLSLGLFKVGYMQLRISNFNRVLQNKPSQTNFLIPSNAMRG